MATHAPLNPSHGFIHGDTPMFVDGGDPFRLSDGCGDINGMPASCNEFSDRLNSDTARFALDRGGVHQQELKTTNVRSKG